MIEPGAAKSFELVGYHDLEGRPVIKMAMQVVNDKWYLYLAHFWVSGWTILEVTDPSRPKHLKFIPGPNNTATAQVQVADGIMVTALEKIMPGWGDKPGQPFEEGIYIWDVKDPINPKRLAHFKTGATGTHRNHWDGGRYIHLAATARGFAGHIYVIVDIADPTRPVEVGRWWLPEQWSVGGAKLSKEWVALHGPAYPEGNRAYLGYGGAGMVILNISDITLPTLVSRLDFHPPWAAGWHVIQSFRCPGGNWLWSTAKPLKRIARRHSISPGLWTSAMKRMSASFLSSPSRNPRPAPPTKIFARKEADSDRTISTLDKGSLISKTGKTGLI